MDVIRLETGMMGNNNYVVVGDDGQKALLIDCAGEAGDLIAEIRQRGLSIEAVLLTHGHIDHIQAADTVVKYFSCPLYIHAHDRRFLTNPGYNLSTRIFGRSVIVETEPEVLDESLELAGFTVKVLHTPGHTPGSVCYHIGDVIFTGDTLFADSIGAELPPFGYSMTEIESIRRELFSIDEDCLCYPGHGAHTSLHYERKNNLYCRI